MHGDRLS